MRGLVRPHLPAVEFLIGVSGFSPPSCMYLMAEIAIGFGPGGAGDAAATTLLPSRS